MIGDDEFEDVYLDDHQEAENRAIIDGAGQLLTGCAALLLIATLLCSITALVVIYG